MVGWLVGWLHAVSSGKQATHVVGQRDALDRKAFARWMPPAQLVYFSRSPRTSLPAAQPLLRLSAVATLSAV